MTFTHSPPVKFFFLLLLLLLLLFRRCAVISFFTKVVRERVTGFFVHAGKARSEFTCSCSHVPRHSSPHTKQVCVSLSLFLLSFARTLFSPSFLWLYKPCAIPGTNLTAVRPIEIGWNFRKNGRGPRRPLLARGLETGFRFGRCNARVMPWILRAVLVFGGRLYTFRELFSLRKIFFILKNS